MLCPCPAGRAGIPGAISEGGGPLAAGGGFRTMTGTMAWRPCQYPLLERGPREVGGALLEEGDSLIRCTSHATVRIF